MVNETNRQKGTHADVVRSLRNTKETKQFFGDECEVNGELNKNVSTISLQSDSEYPINNPHATNPLSSEDDLAIGLETGNPTAPIFPHNHVIVAVKDLIELEIFVRNIEHLKSLLMDLADEVVIHVFDMFIDFMRSYFTKNCRCISEIMNEEVSFESVFETTMNIIRNSAKSNGVNVGEYIENIDSKYLRSKINEFYNRQRIRQDLRGQPTEHCKICFGTYYVQKKETV